MFPPLPATTASGRRGRGPDAFQQGVQVHNFNLGLDLGESVLDTSANRIEIFRVVSRLIAAPDT